MPAKKKGESQSVIPPGHFVVPIAYVDSISLQDKFFFPGKLQIGEQASSAFINALTPQLTEAQLDIKHLGVVFSCIKDTTNMTIEEFAAAGGHAYIIPLQGSQMLPKILALEEDIKKEKGKLAALQQVNTSLLNRIRNAEKKLADMPKEETSNIGAQQRELADEKQRLIEGEEEIQMNKANFDMLQAHLVRSCAIIVRQLLQMAWSRLTPQQKSDAAEYRYYSLNAQAHPTFTDEDREGVEHALHHLHDVPPRAMSAVRASFKVVFGRDVTSTEQMFSYNSGNPAVALRKAVEAIHTYKEAQSKAMQGFMTAQSKVMKDFFEAQDAESRALLGTLTDLVAGNSSSSSSNS